jgi:rhodanese-related sulfurtransferase
MNTITVNELLEIMNASKEVKVIDVRTPAENRAVFVDNMINIPVEKIMDSIQEIKGAEPVYVFCNSGIRGVMVCEDLALHGVTNLVNVDGGMQAWIKADLPFTRTKRWSMPMMQQVMAIAGTLIISGVLASQYFNPNFVWLSGGVGMGLLYAGLSGNCYMTEVLALMPWNK